MKSPWKKTKTARRRTVRPESHRRRLERLVRKVLAGEVSIHAVAEMSEEPPPSPHRRMVE